MSEGIVRVRDVMQPEVPGIDGMASARGAAAMMRAAKVSELLVARRHADDAWGIVTFMDLVKGVLIPGRDPGSVLVYEIMTKPVITVPAQMDIRYALRLIMRIGVHRAPVEHHGDIIGMVTLAGIVLDNNLF